MAGGTGNNPNCAMVQAGYNSDCVANGKTPSALCESCKQVYGQSGAKK